MPLRIASLLPSATEIVCALGAQDELVGISHECDFPPGLQDVPALTRSRVAHCPSSLPPNVSLSLAIDHEVRELVRRALAVYDIELEQLKIARPDVIVTQDSCDVCAVSLDDVQAAVARLAQTQVRIVSLHPQRLDDIFQDIQQVGDAIGRTHEARTLVSSLRARVAAIRERTRDVLARPSVLTIEWIEPSMIGGLWMPELCTLAGGAPLVTVAGEHAPTLSLAQLEALDPDVVLIKPCGFKLEQTLAELPSLPRVLPWQSWRAVANHRVFIADGNAFFNRSGPRIVESLEILAACIHPELFSDFASAHRNSFQHIAPDLTITAPH